MSLMTVMLPTADAKRPCIAPASSDIRTNNMTSSETAPQHDLPFESEGLDLVGILSSISETAYMWDIKSDTLEWESNAVEVLGVSGPQAIATGAAFQAMIATEHLARRQQALAADAADKSDRGTSFRVRYRFLPGRDARSLNIWLDDHGRVWSLPDGKPARVRGVLRVVDEPHIDDERLRYRNDHDELTGQLNRTRLTEALGAVIGRAERTRKSCAFLMAAVNNLSVVNETFGYDVGDEVIAAVARAIKQKLRSGDSIGRYSSNKFGIILSDCGPGAMRIAAERFTKAVRDMTIQTSACTITANVSIGGVIVPDQAAAVQQALSHSLQALDAGKQRRTDGFTAFEPSHARETTRQRNMAVADDVISALDENRMRLVLQPMISAETGKPALYECLLRMQRPDGTIVSAGEFIAIAEQLGLARLIDRRALELSLALVKRNPTLHVSINVSSLTASDREWMNALHNLTGGDAAIARRLTIEITETAAIHDLDQTIAFVDTLRELGCKVAIDDFGAGYTSFRNLKVLNVDMVKIDGAFVKDLATDMSDQVFIKTMVELAKSFNMETVAEWVGDEQTAKFLIDAGITYLQGFYYGVPMTPEEVETSLGS